MQTTFEPTLTTLSPPCWPNAWKSRNPWSTNWKPHSCPNKQAFLSSTQLFNAKRWRSSTSWTVMTKVYLSCRAVLSCASAWCTSIISEAPKWSTVIHSTKQWRSCKLASSTTPCPTHHITKPRTITTSIWKQRLKEGDECYLGFPTSNRLKSPKPWRQRTRSSLALTCRRLFALYLCCRYLATWKDG